MAAMPNKLTIKLELDEESQAAIERLASLLDQAPMSFRFEVPETRKITYEVRCSPEIVEENATIGRGVAKYLDKHVRMTRDRIWA
jgi:hypothetical protein